MHNLPFHSIKHSNINSYIYIYRTSLRPYHSNLLTPDTMAIQTVILVGAGGNLGPHILKALLDASFTVTVLTRKSSQSTFPSSVKVVSVSDDYPESEVIAAFLGQDAVVSTVGGLAIVTQKILIDAAIKAGVQRFVPAEFGGDSRSQAEIADAVQLFAQKREVLDYLRAKQSPLFSWSALATSVFFDWGLSTKFLHFDIPARKALILNSGDEKWATTNVATIGLATARTLLKLEETRNRWLLVQSFSISQNEVLAALEKATGGEWEVQRLPGKGFITEEAAKAKQGDVGAMYELIFGHLVSGTDHQSQPDFANELLGIEEENLEEVVRKVVQEQK